MGTYVTDHNYFLPYEVFCIYALRTYRLLARRLEARYGYIYPSEYRFLLANDFFSFVRDENAASIATLTGTDVIRDV